MVAMLNKFFIIVTVLVSFVLVAAGSGYAQEECNVNYEMITKLYHPDPGSYTVWDSLYGQENKDEGFISVVNYGDGGVLTVGEVVSLRENTLSMVLVHFDRRGRKVWDKYHYISGLGNIVKMLPYRDGVVVLANRRKSGGRGSLWLGFFGDDGILKSQKIVSDKEYDLFATDITFRIDGDGFVVSVTADREFGLGKNKVTRKNAVVYLLDKNGNELSSRSYILGTDNEIEGLSVSKFEGGKSGYIATGYFESPSGKKMGWVLRLNDDLSYVWQKEYSRGLSANIKLSSGYRDRYILTFGEVMPVGSNALGSWLMLLDGGNGETMWQRYYYGETARHDYSAKGLYVNKDGLITLMMMAKVIPLVGNDDDMSYVHLLTLSPRGVTLSGDSYYYGKGGYISQLIEGGNGSRIMVGNSLVPIKDLMQKKKKHDGKHPAPLKEMGGVNLPDVILSDKTNAGLAMLKNKIDAQEIKHISDSESANGGGDVKDITRDGWVLVGDMPEAYSDPCARKLRELK